MHKKLAIFDIDGTIAVKGEIPESVHAGLRHLQSLGYLTTVSTGRSYVRVREALGGEFETVVAPDALIIVEHGSKIVNRDGIVVSADYFKPNELDHVIDFSLVNLEMIRLIWYVSPDPAGRVQIWCKTPADIERERTKRASYADLFCCSLEDLRERLGAYPVSSVSVKLEDFISVENLKLHFTRSEIDILFQDGMMEYIRNISDKSKAVQFLEQHHGIAVADMMVAGNAINDVDMLNLPAGKRILVGTGPSTDVVLGHLKNVEQVVRVDTPEDLGLFLQKIES